MKKIRGITQHTLNKYQVDVRPDGYEFPIWDVYGRIIGSSLNLPNQDPKYYHMISAYYKHKGMGYLYNEHMLPELFYGHPVIVVEGNWDCLTLAQEGFPVVAATTNHLRNPVIEKIKRYTDKIVLWFDDDGHGRDGIKGTRKRLDRYQMKYRVFRTNKGKDANDILQKSPEDFQDVIQQLRNILSFGG